METEHLFGVGLQAGAYLEAPSNMFQRARVLARFKLAQAEERPSRRSLVVELDEFGKCLPAALVLIAVIEKRPQEPPPLRPARLQLKSLPVDVDGLRKVVSLSRGGGLRGQFLEGPRV